jgi:glutathione S-transferase
MPTRKYVDLEAARSAPGLRLIIAGGVPSPWSVAAKAILDVKDIPALIVRKPRDTTVEDWTGVPNVPVLVYDDQPARSGWAETLAFIERMWPEVPVVPREPEQRARMFGLSHELLGEGGLMWWARLLLIDLSIESEGKRGFPLSVARYLASRYGHTPGCSDTARAHVSERLAFFDAALQGKRYYIDDKLTAVDIYSAAVLASLAVLPDDVCPMLPIARAAFGELGAQLASSIPRSLLAHREQMHREHMRLPLSL